MKYKGKKIEGRNVTTLVIPRPDGDIAFIMEAVENFDEFDKLVAKPEAPEILRPGNVRELNLKDTKYQERLLEFAETRSHYMTITALKATTDLEWETVKDDDPATWGNWATELTESGFNDIELGLIVRRVAQANSLDETMLDDARSAFLQDQARRKESTSLMDEQPSI